MTRPSRDETMMDLAFTIAKRSTCPRREVGAVLVDVHGRVIGMGHNGVARGEPHCSEGSFCGGENHEHGVNLIACVAAHAEMNALLFCPDIMRIDTLYVTASPCSMCIRYLLNSSCRTIVYRELYDAAALERWSRVDRMALRLRADGTIIDWRNEA